MLMRPTPAELARLALDALRHQDALGAIAQAADYADRIAITADPARTAAAYQLTREAEAAAQLYQALDYMAEAAEEMLADAAEAEAQHPND